MDDSLPQPEVALTPTQQRLNDQWEAHLRDEFALHDADGTITTMTDEPCVNHVPVLTGGRGGAGVRDFYAQSFLPHMPPDTGMSLLTRTIGAGPAGG